MAKNQFDKTYNYTALLLIVSRPKAINYQNLLMV